MTQSRAGIIWWAIVIIAYGAGARFGVSAGVLAFGIALLFATLATMLAEAILQK